MTSRKNWSLSVSTCWSTAGESLYKSLSAENIHHIEYSFSHVQDFVERDFIHQSSAIAQKAANYGIQISSVHLPFLPFETMDPADKDIKVRKKIAQVQGDLIKAVANAEIPIAVIHPSGEPYSPFERGERMKYAIETLHEIAQIAKDCGVRLAVENLPRTCLCNIHEELRMILMEIPSLYACFDTNHSLRQPNPDAIRALGDKIITLHLSDFDMIDERHLLPFLGRNNWHDIMLALEEVNYDGYLTFEVPCKDVLPTKALTMAYNKLMEI